MITANLRKIGLKMREWHFRELSSKIPSKGGSTTPLPPPESTPLALVVQKLDSTIHQINLYPVDKY